MALVAPAMNNAVYGANSNEERETGVGFEFTRRKRWPHLLLQELVGSALFCLKPVLQNQGSSHSSISGYGWKMVYVSPAVGEMLSQKPNELEGKDFFDLVFAPDQPQLQSLLTSLVTPTPPLPHQSSSNITTTSSNSQTPPFTQSTSSQSYTTYVRMMADSPVVWELRAHATGQETVGGTPAGGMGAANVGFGYGGNGALVPQPQAPENGDGMKGKAIWIMGRKAVENNSEDANGQSLDSFLELKLENERLREELRKLQQDMDDEDIPIPRPLDPAPAYPSNGSPGPSSPSPSSSSSSTSDAATKTKPVKKRQKKISMSGPATGVKGEGEGLHVCVTCGRTDSPEWRKGPMGPKTLCNACGLRWAKRNSTAPSRKEKKAMAEAKQG